MILRHRVDFMTTAASGERVLLKSAELEADDGQLLAVINLMNDLYRRGAEMVVTDSRRFDDLIDNLKPQWIRGETGNLDSQ